MKIITLGEIMLRLSPEGSKRFVQVDAFDVIWGGGEANVAVSCARCLLRQQTSDTRDRPGGGQRPAPLRGAHRLHSPRWQPCGNLLLRDRRFDAPLEGNLRPRRVGHR